MAQTFLEHGDNVVVAGRSGVPESLKSERLFSTTCDVLDGDSLRALGKFAHKAVGVPDLWVHLAAVSHAARDTIDQIDDADLRNVVQTNVLGTLLSTKAALLCGARTIFLFDGAGTDGRTTPKFAAYGATKAGLVQFMKTINAELKQKGERPRVNLCSPGMVITDLLLRNEATVAPDLRRIFNILCERPSTVAAWLVPRLRDATLAQRFGLHIRFLTMAGVVWRFLTARRRRNRLIDEATGALVGDKVKVQ